MSRGFHETASAALLIVVTAAQPSLANNALEADSITVDEASGIVEAVGQVQATADGRRLSTEKIYLDRDGGVIEVPAPLALTETDGTKIAADAARINTQLDRGSFSNLTVTPAEGGRFAASRADKDGEELALRGAVFTACPACEDDPQAAPLWQIRAGRIDYDRAAQDVSYRHSRLEVYGWPVAYLPYMAHAGPEVTRRSGFLAPSFASSGDFGTAIETPYFFDLAPNYDLTLTPRFSQKQDPFLTTEWRHLTRRGSYQITAYGHSPQDDLLRDDDKQYRSGLLADGQFSLAGWDVSASLQEASDDLFFRSYRLNTLSRLENKLIAQRQFGNQSLRLATHRYRNTVSAEEEATVDLIAPSLTHSYYRRNALLGGTLNITNQLTHLVRDLGIDTTHAQSTIDWSKRHITRGGFVLTARNRLALDAYELTAETAAQQQTIDAAETFLSANALALGLAYPLQRVTETDRQTLSPHIQLVAATDNQDYDAMPYSSTGTRSLTRAQLFQPLATKNEASRANFGLTHSLALGQKLTTEFFIGQSYNLSDRSYSDVATGYGDGRSALLADWKLAAGPLSLVQKARFDKTGNQLLRSESAAKLGLSRLTLTAGHSFFEAGQSGSDVLEEATAGIDWQLSQYWKLTGAWRENLETDQPVRGEATLTYEDDCTLASIEIVRDYSRISGSNIEPETSINFSFTLQFVNR